jgi:uncharacterized membrane protein
MMMPFAKVRQLSDPLIWKAGLVLVAFVLLAVWLMNTPPGVLGKADAVGYAVCHRIDLRSFHIGIRQMPLCARCSGMYLGAVIGLSYLVIVSPRRAGRLPRSIWIVIGLLVLAFVVDSTNSYLHLPFFNSAPSLYEPQNWLRSLTGAGMGLAMAIVVSLAFNQVVWKAPDPRPLLPGLRSVTPLLALALTAAGLLWTEQPLVLYPLALVSAAGVLLVLTLVYAVLWLGLLHKDNRYERPSQLYWPILAGFVTGLLQIALLDALRFMITGTWQGFHLG